MVENNWNNIFQCFKKYLIVKLFGRKKEREGERKGGKEGRNIKNLLKIR